jgi:hypothetical protein
MRCLTVRNRNQVPITDLPTRISHAKKFEDDPERVEFLVRVEWLRTVPITQAIKERGFSEIRIRWAGLRRRCRAR